MAPEKEGFQKVVLEHVAYISDAEFLKYTQHQEGMPFAGPASDLYRGDASFSTRVDHVDNALYEGYQEPSEYFEAMLEKPHEIIGKAPHSVYFFPTMGVYAMGLHDSVLEVWLSHPAYPKGWFKEPSGTNAN